jgi:hypothetical protein
MDIEEIKEWRNAERFPAVSQTDEMIDWLIAEVERLRDDLEAAYDEMRKVRPGIKTVFDSGVWDKARDRGVFDDQLKLLVDELGGVSDEH